MKKILSIISFILISNITFAQDTPLPDENQRPIARDDTEAVGFGKSIRINIKENDKDPDGDNLTYSLIQKPQYGNAKIEENETYCTYKHDKTKGGKSDILIYSVCDTEGLCDNAKVIINIGEKPEINRAYINALMGIGASSFNAENIKFDYGINRGVTENAITGSGGSGIGFGLEVDYFFINNIGVSTGIQYNRMGGKFNINNFEAKYQSDFYNYGNDSDWDYERIVSIDNLTEDYTVTNIGIPLLLKFKTAINDKISVFANLGILYNLSSSAASTFGGGTIDYGAVYYSPDGVNYGYDNTNANPVETVTIPSSNEDINHLFDADALNLGTNVEAVSIDGKIKFNTHTALLGRGGLIYNLSDKMSVLLGVQYTSGSLNSSTSSEGYRIADLIDSEGKGGYNSPLKGSTGYSTFGITIGISQVLIK